MNKNKIIMCSIGGIAVLAALALGYLAFSAWQEKEEKLEELEASKGSVERIKKAAIAPTEQSLAAIEENRKALAIWRNEALAAASQGDISVDATITPEAFKRQIGDEAREEAHKPGGAEGKIVKEDFAFGFKDLIAGGSMPDRSQLPFLQRQWYDIKLFTDTLSESGAIELLEVSIAEKKVEEPVAKPKKGARGKKAEPEKKPVADAQSYEIKFTARPTALVKTINAFAMATRFITVDSLTCVRIEDTLAAALGDKDKDAAQRPATRRRRRRGADAEEGAENAEEGETAKKGLVIDPATESPFIVTMKLTTYDFGTKAEAPAEVKEVEE